ncbi:hypothetical protein LZ30DRAFT_394773 [Colletotrichum cereale]|nr:hypothetical protein LZ30DRAFT_394773 [Colletotrichum cereale]
MPCLRHFHSITPLRRIMTTEKRQVIGRGICKRFALEESKRPPGMLRCLYRHPIHMADRPGLNVCNELVSLWFLNHLRRSLTRSLNDSVNLFWRRGWEPPNRMCSIAPLPNPGISNFPVPSCPPTHLSSPEYPHISSLANLQETPTDRKVMQVDLRRYHHGSSDENDDGRYLPEDTVSAILFSSPLSPTDISLSSDKPAASDRKGIASYIQGMTRMAEEVLVENLFETVTRTPSSSMALDSPGERIADQHELDVCTGGNTKRLKNTSLVLQPLGIGAGRSTSAPKPTPIGADAEWINFIFGDDGDEVQETALQEARKEAARHIRPSSSSANSYCQKLGSPSIDHDTAAIATYGTFNGGSETNGIALSPQSRCSSGFGLDLTDMGALGNSTNASLETYHHVDTHADIAGSTIVEVAESITQEMQSGHPITDLPSTPALYSASTVAQPPESEVGEVPGPSFQFARPKTFIGRLASSLVQDAGPIVPLSVHNEPNKSGRPKRRPRKKKAKDGRADIRRVPDHDGDPIDGGSDE